jgi:hypothetical protein
MKGVNLLLAVARWRWTPFFAIVAGTLLYVLLVVALVPARIGDTPPPRFRAPLAGTESDTAARTLAATQMSRPDLSDTAQQAMPGPAVAPPPTPPAPEDVSRFGFSPPLPRAEPPAAAPPAPPPVIQPPPPPPPQPPPPAEVPAAAQVASRAMAAPLNGLPALQAPPAPNAPQGEPPPAAPAEEAAGPQDAPEPAPPHAGR